MAQETTQGLITNFSSGVISPLYYGRVDSESYKVAAKEIKNAIIVQSGAAIRRPGTRFSGSCNFSEKKVLFIPLQDGTEKFLIELGDFYAHFHKNGSKIEDGGSAVELTTLWSESDLSELTYIVVDGEAIIAHESGLQRIIHGSTDIDWSIDDPDWYENKSTEKNPPIIDTEDGDIIIRGSKDIAYNSHRFRTSDVGQRLYLKTDTGKEGYFQITKFIGQDEEFREVEDPDDPSSTVKTSIAVPDNYVEGTYTAEVSTGIVDTDVITDWAIQPEDMSVTTPTVIGLVHGRMVLSGFTDNPRRILGSVIGQKWVFRQGYEANLGYDFTLKEDYGNEILWIVGGNVMVIGMDNGVYTVKNSESTNPTVALNLVKQSGSRVANVKPEYLGNYLVYTESPPTGLRQFRFDEKVEQYLADSLTEHAEHLFRDGIFQIAYQQAPYEILWVVTKNGKLHSFARNEKAGVKAWTTHETKGDVLSVAVIPGKDDNDHVYIAVQRERNGIWYTHVEKIEYYRLDKWEECWYVDSGVEWTGDYLDCTNLTDTGDIEFSASGPAVGDAIYFYQDPPGVNGVGGNTYLLASGSGTSFTLSDLDGNPISGIGASTDSFQVREAASEITMPDHYYEGEEVAVFTNHGVISEKTVSSSKVDIGIYASVIRAGYAYDTAIHTLPVPIMMKDLKRVFKVGVFFFESNAGYLKDKYGDISEEIVMDSDIVLDGALNLWTGVKELNFLGGRDKYGEIVISSDLPSPMNIMAVNYEVEV